MFNRDVNSRFEDWLLNPQETLDVEVKQWLDLADPEHQGVVAKALIALENHGGGFLLFGYQDVDGTLVPDPNRPVSLEPYLTDAMNAIVKKRAEPAFHVEVTLQKHPATGEEYPLVRVAGASRVPVRSDSATAGGTLRQHVYYVRAPGPESRAPMNAAEWDVLLRRVLRNQRDELLDLLRNISGAAALVGTTPQLTEADLLESFFAASLKRWRELNDQLPAGHPAKIEKGFFIFSARLIGTSKSLGAQAILEANQSARRYTGWPTFVTDYQEATRPRLVSGSIEAWLANVSHPDVGHADFWRIAPEGNFFLLRGYQEDSTDSLRGFAQPGTVLDITLPVWRLGEFLLRIGDLGQAMFEGDYSVVVLCGWHGLAGRRLSVHNTRRFFAGTYRSSEDVVRTTGQFTRQAISDLLPETVRTLTLPLYEHFDFFKPPGKFYVEELGEMMKNRY